MKNKKKTSKQPKQTIHTKVVHKDGENTFLITKVLEPAHLYFVNDQKQIKRNIEVFEITPKEATEEMLGVVFSKFDRNCIVTIKIKVAGSLPVFMQFLIKGGLTKKRLKEVMAQEKNQRFESLKQVLEEGITFTKDLTAGELVKMKEKHEAQEAKLLDKDPFKGLKVGQKVSHEDYSCEVFVISEIDRENNVAHTTGGKNGTWSNPPELIIKINNVKEYLAKCTI